MLEVGVPPNLCSCYPKDRSQARTVPSQVSQAERAGQGRGFWRTMPIWLQLAPGQHQRQNLNHDRLRGKTNSQTQPCVDLQPLSECMKSLVQRPEPCTPSRFGNSEGANQEGTKIGFHRQQANAFHALTRIFHSTFLCRLVHQVEQCEVNSQYTRSSGQMICCQHVQ